MKYKYIAYENNVITEDIIEAETLEEALNKIRFELGYFNILEIKEIFDLKEKINNINKKIKEVANKLQSINISFDEIKKVDEKDIEEFENFFKKNEENDINFDDFLKVKPNSNIDLNLNIQKEENPIEKFNLIFNEENEKNSTEALVKQLKVVKSKRIKNKELMNFFDKMATLLKSDISIVKGLDIIKTNSKDKTLKFVISIIENDIKNGEQISSSMTRFPHIFPQFYISLISAGEKSGSLTYVFSDLAEFLKRQIKTERKIKTMSIYPLIVIFVLSAMLAGFGFYLKPKMEDLLSGFGVKIPWYANMMFELGRHIYIPYIVIFGYKFLRNVIKSKFYKLDAIITDILGKIALKIPILKQYVNAVAMYYYTNTLSIMLKNNLSIIMALDQAKLSITNNFIKKKFDKVTSEVVKGKKLSQVYKEINVDPILAEMVSIGEESGKLANSFQIIAEYYDNNLQTQIEILTEIFQPLTIVLLGIVILPILLGIFIPIMKATSGSYIK